MGFTSFAPLFLGTHFTRFGVSHCIMYYVYVCYVVCTFMCVTENFFVQEIVSWFCAIRAARLKMLTMRFPGAPLEEVSFAYAALL